MLLGDSASVNSVSPPAKVSNALERAWYGKAGWTLLLRPLSLLFGLLSRSRRLRLAALAEPLDVPVIVVGNIAVGGSGKTPLLIELIHICQQQNLRVGVVSRGYGGKSSLYPIQVNPSTDPKVCGDEPAMIARHTGVPVVVDPDRVAAARMLMRLEPVDLILSDDGLQHYRLSRQLEIAVVDASRGLGNAQLLPEGPLRESAERLAEVDFVVLNGEGQFEYPDALRYKLQPLHLRNLKTAELRQASAQALGRSEVNALAGIGNPQRFFDTLDQLGFTVKPTPLTDHAEIDPQLVAELSRETLVMTEKDAVKCTESVNENCWALGVEARLDERSKQLLTEAVRRVAAPQVGETHGS